MMQDQGLMTGNRRCFTIGPFHSVADWDDVHMRLQKVATRISERQTEALVEKGYWVYMPPYPSLLEANKALLSLQALGLKDVAIMYDGEWKNSISLGYFMRQENAQRRKKALVDRGFNPMMRIQRQAEPRFWLDYEQEPGSGLVELDMQNRPNDFMQRPVPCPEAEFLEADAVASQGAGEIAAQAQAPGGGNPVIDVEEGPAVPDSTAQSAQVTVKTGETAPETVAESDQAPAGDGENVKGEAPTTAADQGAEPPTAGEAVKTTDDGVETASSEVADEAAESGDQQAPVEGAGDVDTPEVETPPKQAVGTGPVDIVSTEPGPVETDAEDKGTGSPAAGAPENETGNDGQKPVGDSKEDTSAAPTGESGKQNAPEGTEKDSGNGTVNGR